MKRKIKMEKFLTIIALWQFLGFCIMLLIVWLYETFNIETLSHSFYMKNINITRGCVLSAAVFLSAIITVGNTYLQQKYIIRGMLVICSVCGKIKINKDIWNNLSLYIEDKSLATFSHGLCPDCYKTFEQKLEKTT